MDKNLIQETATYLHNAQLNKQEITKITAERIPDLTIDDAYLIQQELIRQKQAQGNNIIGPKMGLTSHAKMEQMNVSDPIFGYVFDTMVVNDGDSIALEDYIHPKVEPEIGFVLNKDLQGPGITGVQVLEATAYVFPAIEIIDSRYENFNFTLPDVIADNTSAAGAVFGTNLRKVDKLELDVTGVTLSINGQLKALGTGAAVLGHPAHSVARLANMLSKQGQVLRAGQPILTGGITEAVRLSAGDFVSVKFGDLGDVSLHVQK